MSILFGKFVKKLFFATFGQNRHIYWLFSGNLLQYIQLNQGGFWNENLAQFEKTGLAYRRMHFVVFGVLYAAHIRPINELSRQIRNFFCYARKCKKTRKKWKKQNWKKGFFWRSGFHISSIEKKVKKDGHFAFAGFGFSLMTVFLFWWRFLS